MSATREALSLCHRAASWMLHSYNASPGPNQSILSLLSCPYSSFSSLIGSSDGTPTYAFRAFSMSSEIDRGLSLGP